MPTFTNKSGRVLAQVSRQGIRKNKTFANMQEAQIWAPKLNLRL